MTGHVQSNELRLNTQTQLLMHHLLVLALTISTMEDAYLVVEDGTTAQIIAHDHTSTTAPELAESCWDYDTTRAELSQSFGNGTIQEWVGTIASPTKAPACSAVRLAIECGHQARSAAIWLLSSRPHALEHAQYQTMLHLAPLAAAHLQNWLDQKPIPAPVGPVAQHELARLHALLQNATDLVSINDAQGVVQYISPSVTRMLGYRPEDLIGQSSFTFLHPDDMAMIAKSFRERTNESTLNTPVLMRFRAHNGEWRVLEAVSTNLLHDPVIQGVLVNSRDVTEQVQAEAARRESEERYHQLIDIAPDTVLVISRGTIRFMNRAGCHLLAIPHPEAIIGRNINDFIVDPSEQTHAFIRMGQLEGGAILPPTVYHVKGLDGVIHELEAASVQTIYAGEPAVLVVARDLTDRRLAEQQLRFQAGVLAQVDDAVIAVDDNAAITYLNPAAELMYRVRLKDVRGQPLPTLYTIEFQSPTTYESSIETLAMEGRWRGQVQHITQDGRVLDVDAAIVALQAEDGSQRGMLGVIRDITNRRLAEERLRLLESVVVYANDAVIITDARPLERPGPFIRYVNAAFTTITGYTEQETVGQTPRFLQGPDTDPATTMRIREALIKVEPVRVEILNYRKDGRAIWIDLSIAPVFDQQGQVTHFVSIQRDITKRKELEAQLLQAQKLESIGQLAGGIAHDFNNLLTAIGGYADLALEETPTESLLFADLQEIRRGIDRASDLTRQLLTFARRHEIRRQPTHINTLVGGLERMIHRLIGTDVIVRLQLASTLPLVSADAGQIEQVLVNLAINARDAMPDGGWLTISTEEVNALAEGTSLLTTWVRIRVADTGYGMPREVQARAFEPFFTTKPIGVGTGLGLATSYGIIQQHEGRIVIESTPGQGTTITIDLPAFDASGLLPFQTKEEIASTGHEAILLVDDDTAVRAWGARVLRAAGYTVYEASHGADALAQLDHGLDVALVVTDMVMPEMNGQRLGASVAKQFPGVRILYVSGNPTLRQSSAVESVAYTVLTKPYRLNDFLRAVREALDQSIDTPM